MNELIVIALSSGFAGIIATRVFDYLIARMTAKSKHDKAFETMQKYLSLADATVEQLEERINQIGKQQTEIGDLKSQNTRQQIEIEALKSKRAARDDDFAAMRAHISALQTQINKDAEERSDLRSKLSQFETRNRALWQYLIALLEQMKQHKITPIDPPDALKSDPDIMRILGKGIV